MVTLVTFGHTWSHQVTPGHFGRTWSQVVTSGHFGRTWSQVVALGHGHIWSLWSHLVPLETPGHIWSHYICHIWSHYLSHTWSQVVTSDTLVPLFQPKSRYYMVIFPKLSPIAQVPVTTNNEGLNSYFGLFGLFGLFNFDWTTSTSSTL